MNINARIAVTAASGVAFGLFSWLARQEVSPSPTVHAVATSAPVLIALGLLVILLPFIVARWWVVLSLAGPVIALGIMQAAGATFEELDGRTAPLNRVTVFWLVSLAAIMLVLWGAAVVVLRSAR
ncbi:MAG: hypothetical protein JSS68_19945 [Actinobacteria bacterium]|nr:hypothetical protein [Actinomycetota bacterium]